MGKNVKVLILFLICLSLFSVIVFKKDAIKKFSIEWALQRYCESHFGQKLHYDTIVINSDNSWTIKEPHFYLIENLYIEAAEAQLQFSFPSFYQLHSSLLIKHGKLTSEAGEIQFCASQKVMNGNLEAHLELFSEAGAKLDLNICRQKGVILADIHATQFPLSQGTAILKAFFPDVLDWRAEKGILEGKLALDFHEKKIKQLTGQLVLQDGLIFYLPLDIQINALEIAFNKESSSLGSIHFSDAKVSKGNTSSIILETAVRDDKVMQDFELESFANRGRHSLMVKAPPIRNDYGSKDCVNLSPPTAVSRIILRGDEFFRNYLERGKTRLKRSGPNEELMAIAMGDEEDRSGEAAAERISKKLVTPQYRIEEMAGMLLLSNEGIAVECKGKCFHKDNLFPFESYGRITADSSSFILKGNLSELASFFQVPSTSINDETLTCQIDCTKEERGYRIEGDLSIASDHLTFGCKLENKFQILDGSLQGKNISLKYISFLFPDAFIDVEGSVDLIGNFDHQKIIVNYNTHNLIFNSPYFTFKINSLKKEVSGQFPAIYSMNFQTGKILSCVPIEESIYIDKRSKIQFVDSRATLFWEPSRLWAEDLESTIHGITFMGAFQLDYSEYNDRVDLDIITHAMNGNIEDAKNLIQKIDNHLFLLRIPLKGKIESNQQACHFHCTFQHKEPTLTASISGKITDGIAFSDKENIFLHDLCLNYHFDSEKNSLEFTDLQGNLVLGRPGKAKEYLLGGAISFVDLYQQQSFFDLWMGDRERDLIRLVGETHLSDKDFIAIDFQPKLTHFGPAHPSHLQITFRDWSRIENFNLEFDWKLENHLLDLQDLTKTDLFGSSRGFLKGFNDLKYACGDYHLTAHYDSSGQFDYDLSAKNIHFNDLQFQTFRLNGNYHDQTWAVEQFILDDWGMSADLFKGKDRILIHFLGLHIGDSILSGLKGAYFPKSHSLEIQLDLFDLDLNHLKEWNFLGYVNKYHPKGKVKAKGKLFMDFSKGIQCCRSEAFLQASYSNLEIDGISFDDGENMIFKLISDDAFSKSLNFLISHSNPLSLQTEELRIEMMKNQQENLKKEMASNHLKLETDQKKSNLIKVLEKNLKNWKILSVQGKLAGTIINLKSIPGSSDFSGEIKPDFQKLTEIFNRTPFANWVKKLDLSKGFSFKGEWIFPMHTLENCYFKGRLEGHQVHIKGHSVTELSADFILRREEILFSQVCCSNSVGDLNIKSVKLAKDKNNLWVYGIDQISLKNIPFYDLQSLKFPTNNEDSILIKNFKMKRLEGVIGKNINEQNFLSGKGLCQWTCNPESISLPFISLSEDTLKNGLNHKMFVPASGTIHFEIKQRRIYLTKCKDILGENKQLKFTLSKSKPNYIDFDGNLHLRLGLQPNNLFIKFVDFYTVQIDGTLQNPIFRGNCKTTTLQNKKV